MKLKYRLFLSIALLALGLVAAIYAIIGAREVGQHQARLGRLFSPTLSGLHELEVHQVEGLKVEATLLAQESFWAGVNTANEKELVSQSLANLQKRTGIDLLFFVGPDGSVRESVSAGERFTGDEVRLALARFFSRSGELRRRGGFVSLKGKLYQTAIEPLSASGPSGFAGVATLFPLGSFLRTAGMDSAVSGAEGKWSSESFEMPGEDAVKLTNAGDGIERLRLASTNYFVRIVKLDPEVPGLRLAALAPSGPIDEATSPLGAAFLLSALAALLGSAGLAWFLAQSIARPLTHLVKSVREMGSGGSPASIPSHLADRGDEVGEAAAGFNVLAKFVGDELKQKEKALSKLEKYQAQLLDLNHRLAKKLYENRVMLSLWKEQEKAEDTKDFLSHILEEVLQGLPFHYGCIIIRPLAEIGPEVILARIERPRGKEEISVTDILERSDRTLWLSSLSPELKDFLLKMNQSSATDLNLLQETITASIEPQTPVRKLTVVSLRLAQGEQHMGSLHLITENERFALGASDEEFLSSVAAQVSVALDNRSLQYATRVDALTRLYNRGYMNDRLREEMLRTSRSNRPFTLMMLDIDHFKKVNDTHGHPAGDEVLVGLSSLLKRSSRASDAICRYGGEEIALILVDTALSGAKIFAENIRKTIESESFAVPEGKTLKITVSMGLAEFPSQAGSMTELIKRADEALYQAKREGRNAWRAYAVSEPAAKG